MDQEQLASLGWDPFFADQLEPTERLNAVGRVIEEQKRYYFVENAAGPCLARTTGKLRHTASQRADLPVVGDWVVLQEATRAGEATIRRILRRRTKLSRKAAGGVDEEQMLCANVDVGFIVQGLDQPPNLRRIERFVTLVNHGGAQAVVVLSKSDLAADAVADAVAAVRHVSGGAPVLLFSAISGTGLDDVQAHLASGQTAVVLGPSGAGKSTLINRVAGVDLQSTKSVRAADAKGRHTTTARTLLRLPQGGLIIDTPGIRELELWGDAGDTAAVFDDIAALAEACRFRDCVHLREPGCAVRAAVEQGALASERLAGFQKLQREARARTTRQWRR